MDTDAPHLIDQCWNRIGVGGDRSCKALETATHCHNCAVYAAAGRSLLERDVPLEDLQEWTAVFAQPRTELKALQRSPQGSSAQDRPANTPFSALIFRLNHESFALPTSMLQEVTPPMPIHSIPHRRNDILLGLVNIRGKILLCASLNSLLGLDRSQPAHPERQKMLIVGHPESTWVFPVDEVQRISRFDSSELQPPPVVLSYATDTYTQGVIDWHNEKVNYLDAELLLHSLDRKLL
jgi:chemotaxis-related protein WspD